MMNDCNGGTFSSQVIRLIGIIYSQTMRIYICGELYRINSDQKTRSKFIIAKDSSVADTALSNHSKNLSIIKIYQ
jgi:actin-like ATPase involved in cell morphogenesis